MVVLLYVQQPNFALRLMQSIYYTLHQTAKENDLNTHEYLQRVLDYAPISAPIGVTQEGLTLTL
ncbi:hypothetical protein AGMMS49992_16400 [Clostridia bacterium]|nr:hypothetical protein AGMMS49992_16400 [Clostridia bacterium]